MTIHGNTEAMNASGEESSCTTNPLGQARHHLYIH